MADKAVSAVELLRRLHDCFDVNHLRERQGDAADAVLTVAQERGDLDARAAAHALPSGFLAPNGITRRDAVVLLEGVFAGLSLMTTQPLLIEPEQIDSFAETAKVEPHAIAGLSYPLWLLEDDIKRALLEILGEPFEQQHSGSELNDIFTPRVRIHGALVDGAFMLKGRGLPHPMRAKDAGHAGNQVIKLARSGSRLFVVQHVHAINEDVRAQLRHAIAYLRAHGESEAVGSIWDGGTTARVLRAYGKLSIENGAASIP